jgi:hypothetical protein
MSDELINIQPVDKGYKEYVVAGVTIRAKKSDGGGFYFIIMPDGSRLRHLASVFETMAMEVRNAGNQSTS